MYITGVFLLVGLVMFSGLDLLRANAIKVIIIFAYTLFVITIFAYSGMINWGLGLIMALGNIAGGWFAAKHAAKKGAEFIRFFLVIVVAVAALHYLGILNLII